MFQKQGISSFVRQNRHFYSRVAVLRPATPPVQVRLQRHVLASGRRALQERELSGFDANASVN